MKKITLFFGLTMLLFITSCTNDDSAEQVNLNERKTKSNVVEKFLGATKIKVQPYHNDFLMDGDIRIKSDHISNRPVMSKSAGKENLHWEDNIVYYTVTSKMSENKIYWINTAINHWKTKTNIKFVQRTTQSNYVDFVTTNDGFCTSYIGMIGGRQEITVGNCSVGVLIHEIGHAVGLFHEHNRADRDSYIKIKTENINPVFLYAFDKYTTRGARGIVLTDELDFSSIMMYFPTAFSINGQPTITKLDGSPYQWQQDVLSKGDIDGVAKMYPEILDVSDDLCEGVPKFSFKKTYKTGDRVVYLGNLFEKTYKGFKFIANCQGANSKFIKYPFSKRRPKK